MTTLNVFWAKAIQLEHVYYGMYVVWAGDGIQDLSRSQTLAGF